MTIAICDDEKIIRDYLIICLQNYYTENDFEYNIVEFPSGEEVIMYQSKIDLLFLDINLPGIDGIEVKNNILDKDNIDFIIFISGFSEFVWKAFSKKTLGFIQKPFNQEDISDFLIKYNKTTENNSIEIYTGSATYILKISDIIYINADNVYAEIFTKNESYLLRDSLKNWENRLKEYEFTRIHKSYIINMEHIDKIVGYKVVLDTALQLKIGRTKFSQFKKTYADYCKKNSY